MSPGRAKISRTRPVAGAWTRTSDSSLNWTLPVVSIVRWRVRYSGLTIVGVTSADVAGRAPGCGRASGVAGDSHPARASIASTAIPSLARASVTVFLRRTRRRRRGPRAVNRQGAAEHVAHTARPVDDLDVVVVRSRIARRERPLELFRVCRAHRVEVERERRTAVLGAPATPPHPRAFCTHDVLRGRLEPKLHVDGTAGARPRRDESEMRDPRPVGRRLVHVHERRASGHQTGRQHDGRRRAPPDSERTDHDVAHSTLEWDDWDGGPPGVDGFTSRGAGRRPAADNPAALVEVLDGGWGPGGRGRRRTGVETTVVFGGRQRADL